MLYYYVSVLSERDVGDSLVLSAINLLSGVSIYYQGGHIILRADLLTKVLRWINTAIIVVQLPTPKKSEGEAVHPV